MALGAYRNFLSPIRSDFFSLHLLHPSVTFRRTVRKLGNTARSKEKPAKGPSLSPSFQPSFPPLPRITPLPETSLSALGGPAEATEDITQVSGLMSAAHESNNPVALKRIKDLIQHAEHIQRSKRTPSQRYRLVHWRRRRSSQSANPSPPPPLMPKAIRQPDAVPPPSSSSTSPLEIFVDASSLGIGFVFNGHWLAWTFTIGHPSIPVGPDGKIITTWAELVAAELGVISLIAGGYRQTKVVVNSDNDGVVFALKQLKWKVGRGRKEVMMGVLKRVRHVSTTAAVEVTVKSVAGRENPADGPSRGKYPQGRMLEWKPEVPEDLKGVVTLVGSEGR